MVQGAAFCRALPKQKGARYRALSFFRCSCWRVLQDAVNRYHAQAMQWQEGERDG